MIISRKNLHAFQADFILAETEYQECVVARAISVPVFEVKVPLCTAEDLIILKLIAYRRQDLLDIENILKRHGRDLDQNYLCQWFEFWKLKERYAQEFRKDFPLDF